MAMASDRPVRSSASAPPFWIEKVAELFARLGASARGLDSRTASIRLRESGLNRDAPAARRGAAAAVLRRLLEPLCLMLIVAGLVAA
jgi:Mg2+-importing ATPase